MLHQVDDNHVTEGADEEHESALRLDVPVLVVAPARGHKKTVRDVENDLIDNESDASDDTEVRFAFHPFLRLILFQERKKRHVLQKTWRSFT